MRYRVRARIGHLDDVARLVVERAVRILRAYFVPTRARFPGICTLHRLMLVGPLSPRRTIAKSNRAPLDIEIWAFVDHEAFRGKRQHGARAEARLRKELPRGYSVYLSVFTVEEAKRFSEINPHLARRFDSGIVLFDRDKDTPAYKQSQEFQARLRRAISKLTVSQREALTSYRRLGFEAFALNRAGSQRLADIYELADGVVAVLSDLGKVVHPASFHDSRNSPIDRWPAYNLSLFHHPDDYSCLQALSHYRHAVRYEKMMKRRLAERRPSLVVLNAALAVHHALKSGMATASHDPDRPLNQMEPNLAAEFETFCLRRTEPPSADLVRLIPPLSHYHERGMRFGQARVLAVMPSAEIARTVGCLVESISLENAFPALQE
jgi:hypothetical protein